jgi:hypothetical protein
VKSLLTTINCEAVKEITAKEDVVARTWQKHKLAKKKKFPLALRDELDH